jgi:hypothetical protein
MVVTRCAIHVSLRAAFVFGKSLVSKHLNNEANDSAHLPFITSKLSEITTNLSQLQCPKEPCELDKGHGHGGSDMLQYIIIIASLVRTLIAYTIY